MITLVTGVPGSGKTSYTLAEMLKILKEGNRPLFVHGVPDLTIAHEAVRCSSHSCDVCPALPDTLLKIDDWHIWAPDGAVIFIDEVQNAFRPRSSAAKVPDQVAAFETHRHKGLDFYLVTQHPNLFDSNIKRLVSKHIHLTGTWARRVAYEWPEATSNVQSTATAIKSTYVIPKHVFKLYKSATIHTKLNRKIPATVYALAFFAVFAAWLCYRFYSTRIAPLVSTTAPAADVSPANPAAVSHGSPQDLKRRFDFTPTVPNHPESAPAYAEIAKPKDFPRLVGCVRSEKKCTCYTRHEKKDLTSWFGSV
ncbi:zonular occludens toxin family protein [Methylovulum psychrotolerans]|uniref:Zona occludens toxin N-terminal domain-containing protein n=1 Tax=Methylovulum psychrotolerans TaxID=1704499 RepID=A0A1Z4C4I5_9GAMM|nr:zonular occludens toxin domain-containing protein [Methylovulum psychrotolerans]ASF48429.1 hypothetical protein CEK71_21530 [Methylovulum psychrotolerans]